MFSHVTYINKQFLIVRINFSQLIVSLTATVPHMRSLTRSSAGLPAVTPFSPPPPLPETPVKPSHISQLGPLPPTQHRSEGPHTTHPVAVPCHYPFFEIDTCSPLLSPRTRDHVSLAIQNSWAESTVKRYSGTIKQYILFCDTERVPDHLRFPADEFVLCAFAASSLGKHARTTPRNRLSALKAWHLAHNMEWKGSSRLRFVLNGVHNLSPSSARLPLRPPINAKMLSQLIENLNLASHLDAAVAACAVTAFWGQCRLGELLPTSVASPLAVAFPTCSGLRKSTRNHHAFLLRLPRTKTRRHGEDIVLVSQDSPINPISLLNNTIQVNGIPEEGHIFSYKSSNGFSPLTKPLFLRRCNEIWQALGYPHTTGHCFRIGGTTELLIASTPPDVVKATGRWSSESFLRYWRSLDDIAPLHIRNIHKRKHRLRNRYSTTSVG